MEIIQELPLLSTIAVGFSVAFVCGLIAAKVRLSPIVGYLLAGVLIGPFTPGFVANAHIAEELAEVGILLLMFGVGLHFSIRDLMEVRRIAVPGALFQIAVAMGLGTLVANLWGWDLSSGLMLGLALSVASTVVLLRALEEHKLIGTGNGNIAIGWLIVEDLVMVLALVLIPALAVESDGLPLRELCLAVGKVVIFVALMLLIGKRVLPWLLMTVSRTHSRELFTLCVFAVATGVAFGAALLFDISFALGAFFAGMMIRESDLSHEAAAKALPLQDAFAVLFFVSVGMLFNPNILLEEPLMVLAVVMIITVGKSVAAMAIVLAFRYPVSTALLVASALAQIGEFSFILAALGVKYGLLSEMGRDLILSGALISILLNPAFFHFNQFLSRWAQTKPSLLHWFNLLKDDLAHLGSEERAALKELVILVGHGRVGKHLSHSLRDAHIELVVVDANRERTLQLRKEGLHAIAGDATDADTLRDAAIDRARALIVAVPNPYDARRIVEAARRLNPTIKILVRAHNDEEMEYFTEQGVDLAVMGPREVARCMVEYLRKGS